MRTGKGRIVDVKFYMKYSILLIFFILFTGCVESNVVRSPKDISLPPGVYFAKTKIGFIKEPDTVYFVEITQDDIKVESYTYFKVKLWVNRSINGAYPESSLPFSASNLKVNKNEGSYFVGGLLLSNQSQLSEDQCGNFCDLFEGYHLLSTLEKRRVCRNFVYVGEKWNEVSEVRSNASFFNETAKINRLLPETAFRDEIDRIVGKYIKGEI